VIDEHLVIASTVIDDNVTTLSHVCYCVFKQQVMAVAVKSMTHTAIKLKFHGTDKDFHAARAARSATDKVRGLLPDARAFPHEDVRWGCACVHVYMINYRIHIYKITR